MIGTRRNRRGAMAFRQRLQAEAFTLVETLATLTLVAIILPVAMRGISLATSAASLARRQAEAGSLAEAKLNEMIATDAWQTANLSGDFGLDGPDYRWSADVRDWQGATLRQLSVSVTWTARGKPRAVTLSTLVYNGSQ